MNGLEKHLTEEPNTKEDYIPFGPDWEKELMKLPKKFIIGLYRAACQLNLEHEATIDKLNNPHP